MTASSPPDGLSATLWSAGLRLAGPVGAGARGAQWTAVDDAGTRWTVTVVPPRGPADEARVRTRARRLQGLRHEHLAVVGAIVDLPAGGVAVMTEEVPGADLATVRSAKGFWLPGEVVTVLVPLTGALTALHGAGLAHGDVSAANVILTPQGRPVLVDLLGGDDPAERGTPGVAAPERAGGASLAGDVHALAALGLELLRSGRDVDGSAAELATCLERVVAARPARRPAPADLATEIYARCGPLPVDLPEPAALARASLRRLAERTGAQETERVPRVPRRKPRHRRTGTRRRVVVPAVCALATAVVVGALTAGPLTGVQRVEAASGGVRDPVTAAVLLTHARAQALARGDRAGLRDVTVPGSPAALADAAAARLLGGGRTGGSPARVEVLRVGLRPVEPSPDGATGCSVCARVQLAVRISSADAVEPPPAHEVVLVLALSGQEWRVTEVRPAP